MTEPCTCVVECSGDPTAPHCRRLPAFPTPALAKAHATIDSDSPLTYDDLIEVFVSTGMFPDDARELADAFQSERLVVFRLPEVDA